MRISKSTIGNFVPPKGKPGYIEWDDMTPCFGLMLISGKPTFVIGLNIDEQRHFLTIGYARKIKLKWAREFAEKFAIEFDWIVRRTKERKRRSDRRNTKEFSTHEPTSHVTKSTVRPRLMLYPELLTRGIKYTRRHLLDLEKAGEFPKRVMIGERGLGWVASEIDDFLQTAIEKRG